MLKTSDLVPGTYLIQLSHFGQPQYVERLSGPLEVYVQNQAKAHTDAIQTVSSQVEHCINLLSKASKHHRIDMKSQLFQMEFN
jgi:hypothetical protein